jgi:nicotinamide mononucleotide transporter
MSWTGTVNYLIENWIEALGFITAVVSIWLTVKRKVSSFPIGLVSDLAYLVVFYRSRLFSNALLQIGGLPLVFYGWWYWSRDVRQTGEVHVERQSVASILQGVAAGVAGGLALGFWMNHAHAALPWLDAMLASFSVVGGWWGTRKHISNWWLWIVVNILSVGEFLYQHLLMTALLYVGLIVLAVMGLLEWKRAIRASERTPAPGNPGDAESYEPCALARPVDPA